VGSDDTVFPIQIHPYASVLDWLNYRYYNWSGRIFSESFVYVFSQIPLAFWKAVSLIIYGIMSGTIFLYYKLFANKQSSGKDYIMLGLALTLPLLMDTNVFFDGTLWVTGSMNYFWITAFGLVAFYPVAYYFVRNRAPHWTITILGILGAIVAASSQEQIGIVLLMLSVILTIYKFIISSKHGLKKIPTYMIIFCIVFCVFLFVSLLAPGNGVRLKAETLRWLPDFYTTPLIQHVNYGYRWLLDAFVNHTGFLLVGSWGLLIALFAKKENKDKLDYVITFMLTLVCFFSLAKGFIAVGYWSNFYATWKPQLPSRLSQLIFLPWTLALFTTIIAPAILYRNKTKGYLLGLLYCAVIASIAMITLSPTMYASGVRTLYVPSVILLLIFYMLLDNILDKYKKSRYLSIGLIVSIAVSQYILMLMLMRLH